MSHAPLDNAPHPADAAGTALQLQPSAGVIASAGETSSSALAAREKAAVEARFLMAISRPRNPDNARQRLLVRCANPRFAEVAEYKKPLGGGKHATGASIRLMEEVARQWGNVDVQSNVVFDDAERRTFRVSAVDLETNYSSSTDVILEKTVERRNPRSGDTRISSRVNSQGETVWRIAADEDAFLVKQNANISKARREMIRAVVPGDLVDEARELCAGTRAGEVTADPAAARKRIADSFYRHGVMPAQLCDFLGKPSLEAVTDAELEVLRTIFTALKEGETTWNDVVDAKRADAGTPTAGAPKGAAEQLRQRTAKKDAPAPDAPKKCSVCFRDDGTHDPNAPCYAD